MAICLMNQFKSENNYSFSNRKCFSLHILKSIIITFCMLLVAIFDWILNHQHHMLEQTLWNPVLVFSLQTNGFFTGGRGMMRNLTPGSAANSIKHLFKFLPEPGCKYLISNSALAAKTSNTNSYINKSKAQFELNKVLNLL